MSSHDTQIEQQGTWLCQVCREDQAGKSYDCNGEAVCEDCVTESIVPIFYAALDSEAAYNGMYGSMPLDISAFEQLLGTDFVAKWRVRVQEYSIPKDQRVYCVHPSRTNQQGEGEETVEAETCKQFLGEKMTRKTRQSMKPCSKCKRVVCFICSAAVEDRQRHALRGCITQHIEADFDGFQRGRDFQVCPGCETRYYHGGACNHMSCEACTTNFCFICGEKAGSQSEHWSRQSGSACPKYNFPGDANAHFDDEDDDEEDEDEDLGGIHIDPTVMDDDEVWLRRADGGHLEYPIDSLLLDRLTMNAFPATAGPDLLHVRGRYFETVRRDVEGDRQPDDLFDWLMSCYRLVKANWWGTFTPEEAHLYDLQWDQDFALVQPGPPPAIHDRNLEEIVAKLAYHAASLRRGLKMRAGTWGPAGQAG